MTILKGRGKKSVEWFGNLDYSDVRGTVEPVFGKDWKYDIDKVGSKWVIVEDCYFDEDSSYQTTPLICYEPLFFQSVYSLFAIHD